MRKFESRRGPDGERKKLDDDLKYPLLVQMCPDNLRTHIDLQHAALKGDYQSVRSVIMGYIEATLGKRFKVPASNVRDPNAMASAACARTRSHAKTVEKLVITKPTVGLQAEVHTVP